MRKPIESNHWADENASTATWDQQNYASPGRARFLLLHNHARLLMIDDGSAEHCRISRPTPTTRLPLPAPAPPARNDLPKRGCPRNETDRIATMVLPLDCR